MTDRVSRDHYSYTIYSDPHTARTFDDRRFGGPIGELIGAAQAQLLIEAVGRLPGRTILDVGTGTGRAALVLARAGAQVVGVDPSEEMLAVARQRAAAEEIRVQFQTGDAHQLDFNDRSFEVVVSLRVIMHTPRWQDCVGELCRVADQLVVLDFPSSRSTALAQAWMRRLFAAFGGRTEPYRVFSFRQIEGALRGCGFRIRTVHRQFVLPIALHKRLGSRRWTVLIEGWLEQLGLLRLFGSPVTVVAERCGR